MSAVRLVHERSDVTGAVQALVEVRENVRAAMPEGAEVRLCVTGADRIMVEVIVATYEDRQAAVFGMTSGGVPGHAFRDVSQGLEHGCRGRHRVYGILEH